MTFYEAFAWLELKAEEKQTEQNCELRKMEWLAGILGVKWSAGILTGGVKEGCTRAECMANYGEDIEWACSICPDKEDE